jgi:excisionase family DNA binding protein
MSVVEAAKRKRTYNVRLIKATWPYTVQEIAALLKVHKNAVLRWLKQGLQANRDKRPFLIRGDELIRFLTARKQSKKRKCKLTEFFCFKCRSQREAHLGIADVEIESPNRFRVKAHCAVCGAPMNKMQGIKTLLKIQTVFHVQQLAGQHLIECISTSVNSDLEAT